jgi:hypothetical protein
MGASLKGMPNDPYRLSACKYVQWCRSALFGVDNDHHHGIKAQVVLYLCSRIVESAPKEKEPLGQEFIYGPARMMLLRVSLSRRLTNTPSAASLSLHK